MLTSSSVDDDRVEMISISYPWTTIETDINGTPEKNEIGFGKFKCPKSSRQGIAIDRVEILKEIRINRAPDEVLIFKKILMIPFSNKVSIVMNEPVEDNRFFLRPTIGDIHIRYSKTISRGTVGIQEYFHLEEGAGLNIQVGTNQLAVLTHCDAQNRLGCSSFNYCDVILSI